MGSRKEEERNEKVIRGLMKLPPNRRCINCNSLGPQYVCTNFWTFVCMTCSGIHREFTHRVKSVSMSKFTSQEVEALQSGGNQRAREIYLKDWDLQRQRLPDSSKVEKVRDFIKVVYVDRRYSGGKVSDKPPRDLQSHKSLEDETRRASSYHSYSQSPPYDYQYEDRRYGKHTAVLTRKPGSDRGLYEGKISNFVYSPGRLSEQTFEDRFANEGSSSRVSDYSMSSGGDFRSGIESPNFQKDIGFSSPPIQPSRVRSFEDVHHQTVNKWSEVNAKKEADGIPRPQRTTSLGSFGSFDSNSMSLKSCNSGTLTDVVPEPEQSVGTHQDLSTFPQPSVQVASGNLDLFKVPALPEPVNSAASSIDLFQLPATSSAQPLDLFQPSLDFFASQQQPATNLDKKIPELSVPKNDGWATFDTQPTPAIPLTENRNPATIPSSDGGSLVNFDPFSAMNTNMQWPPFQNSSGHGPSSTASNSWHEGLHNVQASTIATSTQAWNAFEDSTGPIPFEEIKQISGPQVAAHKPPSTCDQYLGLRASEDSNRVGNQRAASHDGPLAPVVPPHVAGQSYTPSPSMPPLMGETQPHATDRKSTNPFDLPYDSDLEQNNVFLEMSSLQAALPDAQLQSTFLGGVTQPWFPQNPVAPYIPAAPQGGLAYMAGQASSPQIPNVQTQGPVASIGGNPFA